MIYCISYIVYNKSYDMYNKSKISTDSEYILIRSNFLAMDLQQKIIILNILSQLTLIIADFICWILLFISIFVVVEPQEKWFNIFKNFTLESTSSTN